MGAYKFAGPRGSKRKMAKQHCHLELFASAFVFYFITKDTFFSESGVILKAVPIPVTLGAFQRLARDELMAVQSFITIIDFGDVDVIGDLLSIRCYSLS